MFTLFPVTKKLQPYNSFFYDMKWESKDYDNGISEVILPSGKAFMVFQYAGRFKVSIDFSSLAAPGSMEQYKDMEVEMKGTDLILPNNLSVGQTLPDSEMLVTVRIAPINMKMNTNVFNRKVEGRESLTTPAGTFDCYVISFDSEAKMGFNVSSSGKQWIAQGVGMAKQESYNKKGKLTGISLLTAFNK